jgi:2-keto-4-pentenoate hydratase
MQQQLGVDSPDFGVLFDAMGVDSGGSLPADELIAPRVEFEIAFVLGADLRGPSVSNADVLAATEGVFPTLEIIDSRITDWRITLPDTVADNASAARFVRPSTLTPVADLDLTALAGRLEIDGEVVATGSGADVLGHPAACVAWLVKTLAGFAAGLTAGDIVLAGALGPSVPVQAGSSAVATIDQLGKTAVTFI